MAVVGPDPGVGGGVRIPDSQNPAAVRYATMMLQNMVRRGLIKSVRDATQHFGGDPTATWRALSRLTGPQMPGGFTGQPTPPTQSQGPPGSLPPGPVVDGGPPGPAQMRSAGPAPFPGGQGERLYPQGGVPPVARQSVGMRPRLGGPPRQQQLQVLQGVLREVAPHLIALGHQHGRMTEQQVDPMSMVSGLANAAQGQIGQSLLNREHPPRAQAGPQKAQQRKLRHLVEYHY